MHYAMNSAKKNWTTSSGTGHLPGTWEEWWQKRSWVTDPDGTLGCICPCNRWSSQSWRYPALQSGGRPCLVWRWCWWEILYGHCPPWEQEWSRILGCCLLGNGKAPLYCSSAATGLVRQEKNNYQFQETSLKITQLIKMRAVSIESDSMLLLTINLFESDLLEIQVYTHHWYPPCNQTLSRLRPCSWVAGPIQCHHCFSWIPPP